MKFVVLAGGVGAARFLEGLTKVINPKDLTVIVNTGDDDDFFGLKVCPDIDTIIYTLSDNHNDKQGWGLKNETFFVSNQLQKLGNKIWFTLGDKDFATHITRTNLLQKGLSLSEVTSYLAKYFSIPFSIIPMSNDIVKTMVTTKIGILSFQEYFVKRKFKDTIVSITFKGIEKAKPAPGIINAIDTADVIIFAPSNPIVSIGTILAISPIREKILKSTAKKIAISPIVGGKAIKGPAVKMLTNLKLHPNALGIAKYYKELLDVIIIDNLDANYKQQIEDYGISVVTTETIMSNLKTKIALAQTVLNKMTL